MAETITLPCKIGDEVWGVRNSRGVFGARKGIVSEMFFNARMELIIVIRCVGRGLWGEAAFATKEDAEASIANGRAANVSSTETSKQVKGEKTNVKPDTLCWTCKKSGGLCSWSSGLVPVEGWEATATTNGTYMNTATSSYLVKSCPEFEEG